MIPKNIKPLRFSNEINLIGWRGMTEEYMRDMYNYYEYNHKIIRYKLWHNHNGVNLDIEYIK